MPRKASAKSGQEAAPPKVQFATPGMFLCVARKFSGKTHLIKYILYNLIQEQRFDYGLVISPTAATGAWNIVPPEYIHEKWSDDLIQRLINKQRQFTREGKNVNCFLVLDDVLGSVNLKSDLFTQLATYGRQFNITIFLIVQKFTHAVPVVVRENSEYVLLLRQPNAAVLKNMYEEFGNDYSPNIKDWFELFRTQIKDYRALVANMRAASGTEYWTIKAPPNVPEYLFDWRQ